MDKYMQIDYKDFPISEQYKLVDPGFYLPLTGMENVGRANS